jgi:hypothetical protein
MIRNQLMLGTLAIVTVAGCSHGIGMGLAPLDRPAVVTATGAQPQSQVTLYHQGAVDPTSSLQVVRVSDAFVRLRSDANQARVEDLLFLLADTDVAPTDSMPNGLRLRHQQLQISGILDALLTQHEANAITAHARGTMVYSASSLGPDGKLYPLGPVQTQAGDFEVRAVRYEFGVHVTVDAAPHGDCWQIPGVIAVSNCSLYVATDGDSTSAE